MNDLLYLLMFIYVNNNVILFLQGVNDPLWAQTYLVDSLCARSVTFRIKIDEYNLAPHYSYRFTVSKFIKDYIESPANNISLSTVSTCTDDIDHVFEGNEDECTEFFSRVSTEEMDMADELLWGPIISSVSSNETPMVCYCFLFLHLLH